LVAAVLFGVFFFQMRESIDSLDVDRLNRLREVDEPIAPEVYGRERDT
jgi:hydrogenase-4 component E